MNDKHRDILRHAWSSLRKDMEPKKLLPHLVDVLDHEDEQKVNAEATREDRIDKLLEILPRKGPAAFGNFLKALQKIQPFLAAILRQESENEEMKTNLNCARTRSTILQEEVEKEQQEHQKTLEELEDLKSLHETLMEENEDKKQVLETRVQELERESEQLEEELLIEKSEKEVLNEDFPVLKESFEKISEELKDLVEIKLSHYRVLKESFEKISEELMELVEKLSHYQNHVQKIKRVHNPNRYQCYMVRKQKMDKYNGGTDAKNVKNINRSFYGAKVLEIPPPVPWTPLPNSEMTMHKIELLPGSTDYQDAMRKRQATAGGMHVQKIKRIHNPRLDQSHMKRKQKMEKYNGENRERQMFHGTDAKNFKHINTQGFNENEEMKTELNRARMYSTILQEEVEKEQQEHRKTLGELEHLKCLHETLMEEKEDEKQFLETRVQESEREGEQLKEELSIEKSEKEVLNEDFLVLKESFEKISEELKNLELDIPPPVPWTPMANSEMTMHRIELLTGSSEYQDSELLPAGSSEYQDAMRKRQATAGGMHVQKTKRIHNPRLDQSYVHMERKQKMDKYKGGNSERQMSHVTDAKNVKHINTQGFNGILLPKHWTPMPSSEMTIHKVQLPPGSSEYQDVMHKLQVTAGGMHVQKIERIQNPCLYQCYMVRKQKMNKDNGGNSERQLFHGTDAKNVKHINAQGFNRSFYGAKGAAAYGRGVYFARDASFSVRYAGRDVGGRFMYLARVLVGQYCIGNPSMIVPPPKDPSTPEVLFDSVVNKLRRPSIFVVFIDNQCYPEYLVTFK